MMKTFENEINILIGGHYQWPSLPDKHSTDSIKIINNIAKQYKKAIPYVFIDDIGASVMCISKCGMRKEVQKIKTKEDSIVEKWIISNIEIIEKNIINNTDESIIEKFKELLLLIKTEVDINKFDTIEIVHSIEKIIYTYAKQQMRPLSLSYILKKKLPKLILEKSINNLTSKQLHKLKKQNNKNLMISRKNDTYRYLTSNYISDEDILLREEIIKDEIMTKASNRCSGLLSTLFHKLVKDNLSDEKSLTIFYVIPEDDKERLENGIKSFITLYIEEYKIKYNLDEIVIITCIIQDSYLLNIYKYNLLEDTYIHTIKSENYE